MYISDYPNAFLQHSNSVSQSGGSKQDVNKQSASCLAKQSAKLVKASTVGHLHKFRIGHTFFVWWLQVGHGCKMKVHAETSGKSRMSQVGTGCVLAGTHIRYTSRKEGGSTSDPDIPYTNKHFMTQERNAST